MIVCGSSLGGGGGGGGGGGESPSGIVTGTIFSKMARILDMDRKHYLCLPEGPFGNENESGGWWKVHLKLHAALGARGAHGYAARC